MKLFIYILIIVFIIVLIKCHSNNFENFSQNISFSEYDASDPYDVLNVQETKPILIDSTSNSLPGFDSHPNLWTIKNQGISDIFNYEDKGGEIIYNIANGFDDIQIKKPDVIIPKEKSTSPLPNTLTYNTNNYTLLGTASNPYFNQYYYIYENEIEQKKDLLLEEELEYIKNYKIYQYVLTKIENNIPIVKLYVGPRNKININDVVNLSLASFQLGPLEIKNI
jgi:hypothetical protein